MKNKGFTLVEAIIVLGLMGVVVAIGGLSISGIMFRADLQSDKLLGAEIGTELVKKETIHETLKNDINFKGKQVEYSKLSTPYGFVPIDHSIATMEDGCYVVTRIEIDGRAILLVGITNEDSGAIGKNVYEGNGSGWVWSSKGNLEEILAIENITIPTSIDFN